MKLTAPFPTQAVHTPLPRATTTGIALLLALAIPSNADIVSVEEEGLAADTPAIFEPNGEGAEGSLYNDDSLTFSDRTHQHNAAAFDESTGEPATGGSIIGEIPPYLRNNPYVRFANDARENPDYRATITTDVLSTFYLLIDNRLDGNAASTGSPNSTDPELGGTLEWVIEGGWERMNTGLTPEGLPDYVAVDEGGDGVGPGEGLNQFYSIYRFPVSTTEVVVHSNGIAGSNMISLVVAPADDAVIPPIASFRAFPSSIGFGETSTLKFVVNPDATAASIDQEIGDVLDKIDETGSGSIDVSPVVDTTYQLTVATPEGNATADALLTVNLISEFSSDSTFAAPGLPVTLSWKVRPDATITIQPGIGDVTASIGADGSGTSMITPTEFSTTYVLTAKGNGREETAEISVLVQPAGERFAFLDIGALDGQVEQDATGEEQIGGGNNGENGINLDVDSAIELTAASGETFSVAIDNLDPEDSETGGLDWRDRGNASDDEPLAFLGEDLVKNNAGMIRVTLRGLPAGVFNIMSYHLDPTFSQCEAINILVTDALGTARETGAVGSAFAAPTVAVAQLNAAIMNEHVAIFSITSTGEDDVLIYFDGRDAGDTEVPLNGLILFREGGGQAFRITSFSRAFGSSEALLEWQSTPGATYIVETSTSLDAEEWLELDDGVESEGDKTTFKVIGIPADDREHYYRVGR